MSETGLAIIVSIGNYANDPNKQIFNEKVNTLVNIQTTIWGKQNMGYDIVKLDAPSGYLSLNSLIDFIRETRVTITNTRNIDYLVISIIGRGNEEYLITSDNKRLHWLKIYDLFSIAQQFFVPTVFCIDVFGENERASQSMDADYESLNVFGFVASEIDYFGFITNALYQRKDAVHLTDVIEHIMIWNKYIFTVPKQIEWDNDDHDDNDTEYEKRESKDNDNEDADNGNVLSIFDQNVKHVSATHSGGLNWIISYSIDRKSWGPFLCKYDYSVYVHDKNNNRKPIKDMKLYIETPIGTPKQSKFKKILQNGSFINETIRQEGQYAVGNTSFSVSVTDLNERVTNTPKIFI